MTITLIDRDGERWTPCSGPHESKLDFVFRSNVGVDTLAGKRNGGAVVIVDGSLSLAIPRGGRMEVANA